MTTEFIIMREYDTVYRASIGRADSLLNWYLRNRDALVPPKTHQVHPRCCAEFIPCARPCALDAPSIAC
jgi:hypothetical protein